MTDVSNIECQCRAALGVGCGQTVALRDAVAVKQVDGAVSLYVDPLCAEVVCEAAPEWERYGSVAVTQETPMDTENTPPSLAAVIEGFATAAWADAWASAMEDAGRSGELSGQEITDIMPEVPSDAVHMARTWCMDFELKCAPLTDAFAACRGGELTTEALAELGHYAYMEAIGHGVGFGDKKGRDYLADHYHLPSCDMGAGNLLGIAEEMVGGES